MIGHSLEFYCNLVNISEYKETMMDSYPHSTLDCTRDNAKREEFREELFITPVLYAAAYFKMLMKPWLVTNVIGGNTESVDLVGFCF